MDLKVTFFEAGYCSQLEKIAVQGGKLKSIRFPATVVLIEHPEHGYILFDTGYADHFFAETKSFPYCIYGKVTPVVLNEWETMVNQLRTQGIEPDQIRYIILSHFHADHIGGCRDFPKAKFICSKTGYEAVKDLKGLPAVSEGFIPGLLPDDFEARVSFFEEKRSVEFPLLDTPFKQACDIFGDGTLIAVDLPGHMKGHYGLYLQTQWGEQYFFIGDACWNRKAFQEFRYPHLIATLVNKDQIAYKETIENLHLLHERYPEVQIVPSHCQDTVVKLLPQKIKAGD